MKGTSCNESLVKFINNMDSDTGWWHSIPIPGKNALSEDAQWGFPPLSKVFGIHKDAMSIHWMELGCFKRHGKEKINLAMKSFDMIKDNLMDRSNVEVSKYLLLAL